MLRTIGPEVKVLLFLKYFARGKKMSEKLLEQYIIKIPITLKHNLSKLTDIEIKAMTADARMLMAKHCHNSAAFFNPKIYLDEEESK